ncbi:hypothetical protein TNCV_4339481 [Trichonephila clavipes]|nr:hypothetical protein TNCV_4339481 [Trichonephila clavipes]
MGVCERDNKRKKARGLKESSVSLRQHPYKKKTPEVGRFKSGVPSSLEGNRDRKRRPPNKDSHKRRLPTSTNQQVKKRAREENNGQVTARSPRHGPNEERPLQLNQIQPGRSNQYNIQSRGDLTRKVASRSSGRTAQPKERPVRSRRD